MSERVQCNYCQNSYLTAFQFYKHANKAHLDIISTEGWYCCTICNVFLPSSDSLISHKAHAHISSKSSQSERVQCHFCSDSFCSIQQYYKHANKAHKQIIVTKWHPCQVCEFYLPSLVAMTNHKGRAHSSRKLASKRVQCSFCPDTICSLQQYYKHANKEHLDVVSKEWHLCDACNFYLPSFDSLTNHKGRAHSVRGPNPTTERVPCAFCPDTLCSLQQYYKHANKDHWAVVASGWHLCEICQFYLPTAVALTNHKGRAHAPQKSGARKVQCGFCPESFFGVDEYHKHANQSHLDIITEQWQIHCKICWQYFPTSITLKKHKEQFHSSQKSPMDGSNSQTMQVVKQEYFVEVHHEEDIEDEDDDDEEEMQ